MECPLPLAESDRAGPVKVGYTTAGGRCGEHCLGGAKLRGRKSHTRTYRLGALPRGHTTIVCINAHGPEAYAIQQTRINDIKYLARKTTSRNMQTSDI